LCTQEQPPAGKADKMGNYPQETVSGAFQKKPLPAHGAKRQLMAPGGQLMAQNDSSWGISAVN